VSAAVLLSAGVTMGVVGRFVVSFPPRAVVSCTQARPGVVTVMAAAESAMIAARLRNDIMSRIAL
jgi:hypothetical protein